jgi:hypothetical protein
MVIRSLKSLQNICNDYQVDFQALYDDKLSFRENLTEIFYPILPWEFSPRTDSEPLKIHENCFLVRDKNGYYCNTHTKWVHKYKWRLHKEKNFMFHYKEVTKWKSKI